MRSNRLFWRLSAVLALVVLAFAPFAGFPRSGTAAYAQEQNGSGPVVRTSSRNGLSPALRDLKPQAPEAGELRELPRLRLPKALAGAGGSALYPVDQSIAAVTTMPDPIENFEGVGNVDALLPPDTNGDIGPDHYVQMVNVSFAIFDRDGMLLVGPLNNNTLFDGFGGPCEATNDGDPIVLYDHLADRWLMSQFALPNFPAGPFYECIAISQTPDPTGAWYRYEFLISNTKLDDYPKFGVWPDAYYMSINQFNQNTLTWGGAGAVAFERDAMLVGDPATMVYFDIGAETLDYGGMLPADLDGPAPPAGTPNYFVEWDDSTWLSDPDDTLRIWEFNVDFVTPANSSFGMGPLTDYDPNLMISTLDVDPDLCGFGLCIPQPGTPQRLDPISDRLMFRLQYRDFGSYQVMLSNHTVDADGADRAGIHWFELRDSGSGWEMNQENVFAPAGTLHRWMGSVAMDGAGDIALGYSASSGTVSPSIYYTGRLAGDPINTLPQGEAIIITGSGNQTHPAGRWGDYSMMAVDPTDDCTFWYTQEYLASSGIAPWQTRVGSFLFPECATAPDQADLSIAKVADPDPVSPGQELTYTITVSNAGPDDADGVIVDDTLPSGVTLVSVSSSQGGCTSLPCDLGTIASGVTNVTVTVVVQVDQAAAGPLENTAEVSSTTADPDPTDNSVTVETQVAHNLYLPLILNFPSAP
jgi:uncharacterized repeat protein (TIGR01451 family)